MTLIYLISIYVIIVIGMEGGLYETVE